MQLQTGNLYGTVMDGRQRLLEGVTITLKSGSTPQVQVTNVTGQVRFLGMWPGSYTCSAELDGFETAIVPNVEISLGHSSLLEVTLEPATSN
jgi:hypothetical protein